MPKKREPIDELIDALVWMRAVAKKRAKRRRAAEAAQVSDSTRRRKPPTSLMG